jgi:hypothetical protein
MGSGLWERPVETMADIHDRLVRRLDPRPGERSLDVASGTGAVAARAARAGADVTAQDLAPQLIATVSRLAGGHSLPTSKARPVVTTVVVEGRSQGEAARAYGVSQGWVSRLVARYRAEGRRRSSPDHGVRRPHPPRPAPAPSS